MKNSIQEKIYNYLKSRAPEGWITNVSMINKTINGILK